MYVSWNLHSASQQDEKIVLDHVYISRVEQNAHNYAILHSEIYWQLLKRTVAPWLWIKVQWIGNKRTIWNDQRQISKRTTKGKKEWMNELTNERTGSTKERRNDHMNEWTTNNWTNEWTNHGTTEPFTRSIVHSFIRSYVRSFIVHWTAVRTAGICTTPSLPSTAAITHRDDKNTPHTTNTFHAPTKRQRVTSPSTNQPPRPSLPSSPISRNRRDRWQTYTTLTHSQIHRERRECIQLQTKLPSRKSPLPRKS